MAGLGIMNQRSKYFMLIIVDIIITRTFLGRPYVTPHNEKNLEREI